VYIYTQTLTQTLLKIQRNRDSYKNMDSINGMRWRGYHDNLPSRSKGSLLTEKYRQTHHGVKHMLVYSHYSPYFSKGILGWICWSSSMLELFCRDEIRLMMDLDQSKSPTNSYKSSSTLIYEQRNILTKCQTNQWFPNVPIPLHDELPTTRNLYYPDGKTDVHRIEWSSTFSRVCLYS
jgi:hypothetical protein